MQISIRLHRNRLHAVPGRQQFLCVQVEFCIQIRRRVLELKHRFPKLVQQ